MAVDLTNWTQQLYGTQLAEWQISDDGLSVLQVRNSDPSLYCSDFTVQGSSLEGEITVETTVDDDFIGFALGYSLGDNENDDAQWYLVDWKKDDQSSSFSGCGFSRGLAGLAVSEVFGIPGAAEFWGHVDLDCTSSASVAEIARGSTLGSTGWVTDEVYQFRFDVSSSQILAYVNGQLELNITGSFDLAGSFCYYNFSQERVRYSGLTRQTDPPTAYPSVSVSPSGLPSHVPSSIPTSIPSMAPTCPFGSFTDACIPLPFLTNILPLTGSDTGGYVVRVEGVNFDDGAIECQFGDSIVPGSYISESVVTCTAPAVTLASERETVNFSLSIDGIDSFNSVPFTWFGICPASSCVNGYCSGGFCRCSIGWSGDACDVPVSLSVLENIPTTQIVIGDTFDVVPTLVSGSEPLSWTVSSDPVDDRLFVDSRTGNVTYTPNQIKVVEVTVSTSNEAGVSSMVFVIEVVPPYYLDNIRAIKDELASGSDFPFIPIEGDCKSRADDSFFAFCDIEVVIEQDGFRRILPTVGNQDGSFRVNFVPSLNDGGTFNVGAQPAGTANSVVTDTFIIFGVVVFPGTIEVVGFPFETLLFSNVARVETLNSEYPLNIQSAVVTTNFLPGEVDSVDVNVDAFSGNITVSIITNGPIEARIGFVVSTDTIAIAGGSIHVDVRDPIPLLTADSERIHIQVNRGERASFNMLITNEGATSTGLLQVTFPPNFDLLQLSVSAQIPSLSPGESVELQFFSAPEPTTEFNTYSGNLKVSSNTASLIIDFEVQVTSNALGTLSVIAEDEYTFFAEGFPKLEGVKVQLRNLVTASDFQNVTSSTGDAIFADIPFGLYEIRCSKEGHTDYVLVVPMEGAEVLEYVFISRQQVSYQWTVTPTTIDEEYDISIETTFTTFVPAPVIVIEPLQLDVSILQPGIDQINFKITNYGLISVENFEFDLPPANGLKFVPISGAPVGDIPANSTIYYPVKVEADDRRELQSALCRSGFAIWSVQCRKNEWYSQPIDYVEFTYRCPSGSVSPTGDRGGGCCLHRQIVSGPQLSIGCQCGITIFKCLVSLLPLPPLAGCLISAVECALSNSLECIATTAIGCAEAAYDTFGGKKRRRQLSEILEPTIDGPFALGFVENGPPQRRIAPAVAGFILGNIENLYNCAVTIADDCFDRGGTNERMLRFLQEIELEDRVAAENFVLSTQSVEFIIETLVLPFEGLEDIFRLLDKESLGLLQERLTSAQVDDSEEGKRISSAELLNLRAFPLENIGELLAMYAARLNRSLDYYDQGFFSKSDLPEAFDPDMIELRDLQDRFSLFGDIQRNATLRGFDGIYDQWQADGNAVVEASQRARDGVCAKVRVQIKQRAILTREAFQAELQLENSGNTMTNINITVTITDRATGLISTERFLFADPELVGITSVDGSGSLNPSISGSAAWLFLALSDAAPTQPLEYSVGGTLVYTMDGLENSVTLLPDSITVSPDPQLELQYFHEYEIYADDPFTVEIEPSIPYNLAVLVKNVGFGNALGFKIISGQPEIIENDKGLLIDFKVISAQVAGQTASPNLSVDFGSLPAGSSAVGIWTLVSSLQGSFSDYNATFTYRGPIDDDRLALVRKVEIFELTHLVHIDDFIASKGGGESDKLPDFLVDNLPDIDRLPDTLFSSTGDESQPVFVSREWGVLSSEAVVGEPTYNWRVEINVTKPNIPSTIAGPNGDWQYFRVDDPVPSSLVLQSVLRDDGSEVELGFNAWRTSKTKRFVGVGPVEERFFHLLDWAVDSGVYELRYKDESVGVADVTASDETENTILLSWNRQEDGAVFDVLQKFSSQPDSDYVAIETNLAGLSFRVFNLNPGTAYTFLVRSNLGKGVAVTSQTLGTAANVCGNGVLDTGETCDDGNSEDGDCCSSSCRIESAGSVCRSSRGDCDVDDTCDGISQSCGMDNILDQGESCGTSGGCCTGFSTLCPSGCESNLTTSSAPSSAPSSGSSAPSNGPSIRPSGVPSSSPSAVHSRGPSVGPSSTPSAGLSATPSSAPSTTPSTSMAPFFMTPSTEPSLTPSKSSSPSTTALTERSPAPSTHPSETPSEEPSVAPSTNRSSPTATVPSSSRLGAIGIVVGGILLTSLVVLGLVGTGR